MVEVHARRLDYYGIVFLSKVTVFVYFNVFKIVLLVSKVLLTI